MVDGIRLVILHAWVIALRHPHSKHLHQTLICGTGTFVDNGLAANQIPPFTAMFLDDAGMIHLAALGQQTFACIGIGVMCRMVMIFMIVVDPLLTIMFTDPYTAGHNVESG